MGTTTERFQTDGKTQDEKDRLKIKLNGSQIDGSRIFSSSFVIPSRPAALRSLRRLMYLATLAGVVLMEVLSASATGGIVHS